MKQSYLTAFIPFVLVIFLMKMCSNDDGHQNGQHNEQSDHEHGVVEFSISCNDEAQEYFNQALGHLHHMMYEQARPVFRDAAEADPNCAMAHWGIAMTSFQPLWHPTPDEGLNRGKEALETARSLEIPTEREEAYIRAAEAFFTDPEPAVESRARDHEMRLDAWKNAQRDIFESYSDDVDAAAFYALADISYAVTQFSPYEDRDFTRETRAGELMEEYLEDYPEHPGLFHYLIHAYDSPELAYRAEEYAHQYDKLAPETVHALHMPSHIFVRLGKWDETIDWNERSAAAAKDVMDRDAHASAHYVHALDYVMYGYLQTGNAGKATETLDRVLAKEEIYSAPFAGYNAAAPQARYYLEQAKWEEAANLETGQPAALPWEEFPVAEALIHYARGLGSARTGNLAQAEEERDEIFKRVQMLRDADDTYWAYMTEATGKAVDAWIKYEEGYIDEALELMSEAADLEDSMDKHAITPGETYPVRELYGELLKNEGNLEEAQMAFEKSLERTPNRRNALQYLDEISQLVMD